MSDEPQSLLILAASEPANNGRVTRGLRQAANPTSFSEVAISSLQENVRQFLTGIDAMMSASPDVIGGLGLDQVEIYAQIDGKGNIGIAGLASAEVSANAGIKFVLKRGQ